MKNYSKETDMMHILLYFSLLTLSAPSKAFHEEYERVPNEELEQTASKDGALETELSNTGSAEVKLSETELSESEKLKEETKKKEEERRAKNLSYFNLEESDIEEYRDSQEYENKKLGLEDTTLKKFVSKLILYEVVSHYEDEIEAFIERHPTLEKIIDRLDVRDGTIIIHLFEKEF